MTLALYQSRKNVGVEGYFLANRRLPWAAIGLSVMATQASAITFIGTTGQAFDSGMEFIQVYLPQPLVMVLLCALFVPFFYRAKLYTAYEYLERRFRPQDPLAHQLPLPGFPGGWPPAWCSMRPRLSSR